MHDKVKFKTYHLQKLLLTIENNTFLCEELWFLVIKTFKLQELLVGGGREKLFFNKISYFKCQLTLFFQYRVQNVLLCNYVLNVFEYTYQFLHKNFPYKSQKNTMC